MCSNNYDKWIIEIESRQAMNYVVSDAEAARDPINWNKIFYDRHIFRCRGFISNFSNPISRFYEISHRGLVEAKLTTPMSLII